MFTGLSTWLGGGGGGADEVAEANEEAKASRSYFHEYTLWQLQRSNNAFVAEDLDHGRCVIDATLALGDALRVQRRRFGGGGETGDVALANHLVRLLLEHEGSAAHEAARQCAAFRHARPRALDADALVDAAGEVRTRLDPMSLRIIDAWMDTLDQTPAGAVQGTRVTGASRCFAPRSTYERWLIGANERASSVSTELCQSFNVSYTVIEGDDIDAAEADHAMVARQALAPLIEQVRAMHEGIAEDRVRLDVTLNVELVTMRRRLDGNEDADDDDDADDDADAVVTDEGLRMNGSMLRTPAPSETIVTANCALAYRLYYIDAQLHEFGDAADAVRLSAD